MNDTTSRRGFFAKAAIISAGTAIPSLSSRKADAVEASFATKFTPQDVSFMDQYYNGTLEITKGIRETQVGAIAEAMEKAYELKRKGGKVAAHVNYGHYAMFAGAKGRPGQPWVLPQPGISPTAEEFAALNKGDFLITSRVDEQGKTLRDRGVYVVGVTNNYYKFAKTPPDGLTPGRMETSIEEISDVVIDSQVPWDNGLVTAPQTPQMKLCPSSGLAQFLVYWACTASFANLIGTKGKGSSSKPAEDYLDRAIERFEMIGTDRPKIDWVAEKWADLVLGKKARLILYGRRMTGETYGATGSSNMFVNDAVICASSSMIAEDYVNVSDTITPNDIVVVTSYTSDHPDEMNVARRVKDIGAYTVSFGPFATDGDSSGPRLFKLVDDAFNCYSDESAGVIAVPGFPEMVAPLTGLTGNLVHWMLTAQWTDHMARRSAMPYYWKGYHENGGKEYDDAVHPIFLERGY